MRVELQLASQAIESPLAWREPPSKCPSSGMRERLLMAGYRRCVRYPQSAVSSSAQGLEGREAGVLSRVSTRGRCMQTWTPNARRTPRPQLRLDAAGRQLADLRTQFSAEQRNSNARENRWPSCRNAPSPGNVARCANRTRKAPPARKANSPPEELRSVVARSGAPRCCGGQARGWRPGSKPKPQRSAIGSE